jgi:RNA polymerase sigma-70 factor (ECF subfamily)
MSSPVPDPAIRLPLLLRSAASETAKDGPLHGEVLSLFESSRSGLLRYLYSIGLRDHDAEEVAQEVFLALFQHLKMGRARHNLRGWIFRVAHNLGLRRRNNARRAATPEDDGIFQRQIDPGPNPEQIVSARQRQQKLLAIFRGLPEQDRCCLHLRAEGLRYRDIAEALGISLGSVAQSLARSLEKLQRADGRL